MFNPTKETVKWYGRGGSYKKQINLNVDCKFKKDEIVYILNEDEFTKYCKPALYDENFELKQQLQQLQDEHDTLKHDNDSIKQEMQSNHERIIDDLKQKLEDAESKAEKLQSDMNQLHQDHAGEVKELNQKINDLNERMNDVSNLNTVIMQDVNRKNLELKDYENEVDASIRKAVKETEKIAHDEIKKLGRLKLAFNKNNINLNIPIDDIIEDNIPARKQGFLEVITAPQITNGDGDVEDNQNEDNEKQD